MAVDTDTVAGATTADGVVVDMATAAVVVVTVLQDGVAMAAQRTAAVDAVDLAVAMGVAADKSIATPQLAPSAPCWRGFVS